MASTIESPEGAAGNKSPVLLVSANSQPAFDRLPAELLGLILSDLDSPKDLIALQRTCRRAHRVFQGSKAQILEGVIRNAFPSTLLREAVAACKMWPLKAAYDHGQWVLLLPAQQWFLREYWLSPSSGHVMLKEPGLLTALYRLWWLLDRFICTCYDGAIQNIASATNSSGLLPGWNKPLDSDERYRIQRALLRFELYRQLFPPIDPSNPRNDWPYRSTHQYSPSLFLRQLPPWERGELLTVTRHLYRIVWDLHLSIRKQLLSIVPPQASLEMKVGPYVYASKDLMDKVGLYERMLLFPDPDLRSFNRHYNLIIRLGLPFISWLQSQPMADQIHILGLHFDRARPKTLEEEISFIPSSDTCMSKWLDMQQLGGMDRPTAGWFKLWQMRCYQDGFYNIMECPNKPILPGSALQEMGYLFWSDARFDRIEFPPPLERCDPSAERDDDAMFHHNAESMALLGSLRTCAVQSELHEDVWQTLQHSDWVGEYAECFKKSYLPKSVMHCTPLYYGLVMDDEESAQLARRFMLERRELVNELVTRLSDIWMELVMTESG